MFQSVSKCFIVRSGSASLGIGGGIPEPNRLPYAHDDPVAPAEMEITHRDSDGALHEMSNVSEAG